MQVSSISPSPVPRFGMMSDAMIKARLRGGNPDPVFDAIDQLDSYARSKGPESAEAKRVEKTLVDARGQVASLNQTISRWEGMPYMRESIPEMRRELSKAEKEVTRLETSLAELQKKAISPADLKPPGRLVDSIAQRIGGIMDPLLLERLWKYLTQAAPHLDITPDDPIGKALLSKWQEFDDVLQDYL